MLVLTLILVPIAFVLLTIVSFLIYAVTRYAPIIGRIFEEKPLFLPLRLPPTTGGEEVRLKTRDGMELAGTYFKAATPTRVGVLVFCHEFLSDRRKCRACRHLRSPWRERPISLASPRSRPVLRPRAARDIPREARADSR